MPKKKKTKQQGAAAAAAADKPAQKRHGSTAGGGAGLSEEARLAARAGAAGSGALVSRDTSGLRVLRVAGVREGPWNHGGGEDPHDFELLVQWQAGTTRWDSWEPASMLLDGMDLVAEAAAENDHARFEEYMRYANPCRNLEAIPVLERLMKHRPDMMGTWRGFYEMAKRDALKDMKAKFKETMGKPARGNKSNDLHWLQEQLANAGGKSAGAKSSAKRKPAVQAAAPVAKRGGAASSAGSLEAQLNAELERVRSALHEAERTGALGTVNGRSPGSAPERSDAYGEMVQLLQSHPPQVRKALDAICEAMRMMPTFAEELRPLLTLARQAALADIHAQYVSSPCLQ